MVPPNDVRGQMALSCADFLGLHIVRHRLQWQDGSLFLELCRSAKSFRGNAMHKLVKEIFHFKNQFKADIL